MLLYDSEFYIIKSESKVRQLPTTNLIIIV